MKYPKMKTISKNSYGLMDALFDELNLLREGKSTVSRANAILKIGNQICVLAKLHNEGVSIDPKKLPKTTGQ